MTLRTRGHSLLAIVAMLVLARFVIATATTRPAIPPMLAQLASDDPAIRDQAEQQLMALSPEDLLPLRQAIQTALPLHPGEARLLQEIVTHVFLSGENTSGLSDRGFMGVEMKRDEGTDPQIEDDPDFPTGVFIENRLPGFTAYEMLRNGDLILTLASPDLPHNMNPEAGDGPQQYRVRSSQQIAALISKLPAGRDVTLGVLRNGQRINVTLKLGALPRQLAADRTGATYLRYREDIQLKADNYWQDNFADLVGGTLQ